MAKKRILFVDDDSTILRALSMLLLHHRQRWEMVFVHGGVAGLATLRDGSFDVLVTDMMMPELDGLALLSAAKEHSPATIRIMMTGTATDATTIDAFAVLPKPCQPRELVELLELVTRSPTSEDDDNPR